MSKINLGKNIKYGKPELKIVAKEKEEFGFNLGSKSGGYDNLDDDEEGLSNTMIAGAAGLGVAVLAGLAVGLRKMGGGGDDGFDDMFEEVPGPLELNCPTCNGLISITTTQRPIQVGCPMCQSQFVIRE